MPIEANIELTLPLCLRNDIEPFQIHKIAVVGSYKRLGADRREDISWRKKYVFKVLLTEERKNFSKCE